tara:strand:- start:215 stop:538 length:324 start_codon:yes stop_codon:yes gene_type:complete
MSISDASYLKRIKNMEKVIGDHEKTINICLDLIESIEEQNKDQEKGIHACFDLIEGIHQVIDNEFGTNLVSTPPPHIRGRSRKKSRSKRKSSSKRKSGKKGRTQRLR